MFVLFKSSQKKGTIEKYRKSAFSVLVFLFFITKDTLLDIDSIRH